MNILLCSVGRRPYLVRWFKEALKENDIVGKVIAADLDPISPARSFADEFIKAPRVDSREYEEWLKGIIDENSIKIAVSLNDFELSTWASFPITEQWKPLIRFTKEMQSCVEDKFLMSIRLEEHGICTPPTWLGSDSMPLKSDESSFITKGRFGSASRGLRFSSKIELPKAIQEALQEVTTRQGVLASLQNEIVPEKLVIVQPKINGTEFGLDIVCNFEGDFETVLARRKISMRGGETDRAESVNSDKFLDLAKQIAIAIPHPGTMDVDVIVDTEGKSHVIDINPRFGGGYPFSHIAGARIPHAYVAWACSKLPEPEWLLSSRHVVSGKYVETIEIY